MVGLGIVLAVPGVAGPSVGIPNGLDEIVDLGGNVGAGFQVGAVIVADVLLDVLHGGGEATRVAGTLFIVGEVGRTKDATETHLSRTMLFERARFEFVALLRDRDAGGLLGNLGKK